MSVWVSGCIPDGCITDYSGYQMLHKLTSDTETAPGTKFWRWPVRIVVRLVDDKTGAVRSPGSRLSSELALDSQVPDCREQPV
jgi:hypothetical protein